MASLLEQAKKRMQLASLAAQALAQHQHSLKGGPAGGKPAYGPTTHVTMATPGPLAGRRPTVGQMGPAGPPMSPAGGNSLIARTPKYAHDSAVEERYGAGAVGRRSARAEYAREHGIANANTATWTPEQIAEARQVPGLFHGIPGAAGHPRGGGGSSARLAALAALLEGEPAPGRLQARRRRIRPRRGGSGGAATFGPTSGGGGY